MRTSLLIAIAIAAAAAASGCGQADDRDEVRTVAAAFATAVGDRDGAAACRLLSPPTVDDVERQGTPCRSAILELALDPGRVAHVRVYLTNGQATYVTGETAFLDRGRSGWQLSAVGCRFEDGKPHSRPATCEAES